MANPSDDPAINRERAALAPAPQAPVVTPILSVDAPALSPVERTSLLMALNLVRLGSHVVHARVTYDKQTAAEAREPAEDGVDFLPDGEGDDGRTHRVVIVAATLNRQGKLYVKTKDYSRANGEKPWQWTNFIPRGFRSEPGRAGFTITGLELREDAR